MVISELIRSISDRLQKIHATATEQQQDAWWIIQAITGKSEAELLAQKEIALSLDQQKQLDSWLTKHVEQSMPLQYLLGTVPFCDLTIFVEPPVLIPRPETEEWCNNLIEKLKKLPNQKFTILDIGSGSGCIALALGKQFPQATVIGVDISERALALCKKNAHYNHVTNISFIKSDIYQQLDPSLKFDVIVSNPPYIASEEWNTLSPSVTQWEDQRALISGPYGLDAITAIVEGARKWLRPHSEMAQQGIPQLLIEIGYLQGEAVRQLLISAGLRDVFLKKDLEGKDRVACASL